MPAPVWLPVVHWLVPARQRRQCAAAIGARSPSSGLTQDTANELVARQASPPSSVSGAAAGALLSIRTVTAPDTLALSAASTARTCKACVPSGELRGLDRDLAGLVAARARGG